MSFTCGSTKRKGIIAAEDAETVALMRKAGAIPIALSNTPEMLLWWDCYNNLYGRTNNPYDKSRTPGGSSGGEAALISSAGSVIGIATDIGGSIRMPSSFCGIFGHKTTPHVISISGHHPPPCAIRQNMFSYGPMCRYASDIRPMVKVMAGDNASLLKLDEYADISKLKYYYIDDYAFDPMISSINHEVIECVDETVQYLISRGASVEKITLKYLKNPFVVWLYALKSKDSPKFSEELCNRNDNINPYLELIKCFFGLSNHTLPSVITSFKEIRTSSEVNTKKYNDLCELLKDEIHQYLGDDGILLFPSHPKTAPKHWTPILKLQDFAYSAIFNCINVCVTQVPICFSKNGLPIGVQFIAAPFNDHLTISIAEEIEKHFGGWKPPSEVIC